VRQKIYEMIICNLLFNFIPKELFYVKNNSSKYELKPGATLLCSAQNSALMG
jgi:hypothetical protein